MELLLILAGLGAVAYATSGKALKKLNLDVDISNLRVHSISWSYLTIKFDLVIDNPTDKTLTFQNFKGDIIYKKKRIGGISYSGKTYPIAAKKTTPLRGFTAQIKTVDFADEILKALEKNYQPEITIKGNITADGLKFPVDEKIPLKQ